MLGPRKPLTLMMFIATTIMMGIVINLPINIIEPKF